MQRSLLRDLAYPAVAVFIAFLLGALLVVATGYSPAEIYGALWHGAFGSAENVAWSLQNATPLVFTGLAVALAFRAGLFNVGAEGQLILGAFAASQVGIRLKGTAFDTTLSILPLALLAAALAGGLWGAIPGWLKARLGVHEVINTIMMNFIAALLGSYFLTVPWIKEAGSVPQTPIVSANAVLPAARFINPYTRLNAGFLLALGCVFLVWFVLWRTWHGFELRIVGLNAGAATYAGANVGRTTIAVMFASGALAGLGGAEQVLGVHYHFIKDFWVGLGFTGIAVALVGENHPVGVLLGALLFGALQNGAAEIDMMTTFPRELIQVLQAIIIFLVASMGYVRKRSAA
ncbi:MAG: ABC transporter permease [Candidatus Wallbacteria bacterium]|nr:ABC transporter permease [Candidatus Wallbacteria bacterium]